MKFLIAFVFGLFATCLSDITFWRTLIKHKTIWASDEHNGVSTDLTLKDFLEIQFVIFIVEFAIPLILTSNSTNRLSILSVFIFTSMIGVLFFKVLGSLVYEKSAFKQQIKLWIILFILYFILFIQDFYVFDKVNTEENRLSHKDVSAVLSDSSIEISGKDLLKMDFADTAYYSNDKILLCSSNGILVLYENNAKFIECSVLETNRVPAEISTKSAIKLGVVIDDKNRPYIAYALMKKTSFFGSYKTDRYALYNIVEKKIDDYCSELPDWARY